jgi:hypothetical protein
LYWSVSAPIMSDALRVALSIAVIRAPCSDDPALRETIAGLRRAGEIVIVDLPGQQDPGGESIADRELRQADDRWQVVPLARQP